MAAATGVSRGSSATTLTSATAAALEAREKDFRYTCSLCMEPYQGRQPKFLPCHHTFCLPCLTTLEASIAGGTDPTAAGKTEGLPQPQGAGVDDTLQKGAAGGVPTEAEPPFLEAQDEIMMEEEGAGPPLSEAPQAATTAGTKERDPATAGRNDVSRGSFPCPTCRKPVPLPEGGVAALPTNFYVDDEIGPDADLANALCDMCDEDSRQHATHFCEQCPRSLCPACKRCHDVMAPDHHVTAVAGLGQPWRGKRESGATKGLCLIHQDQPLCFHCRRCDVSICVHCRLNTRHEGHEIVDLTRAALQAREEISTLIPTAQQQLQIIDLSLQQVDREDRMLTRHALDVRQQIDTRRDALLSWAAQSHQLLVEEVQAKESRARSQLHSEKASSSLTRDSLSLLLARAARASAADPQVLICRKELKAALLSRDDVLRHQQRADGQGHSSWHCRYDIMDTALVQQDDIRAYMGRVVEGAEEGAGNGGAHAFVSVREMAGRVERLNKEMTENTSMLAAQISSCTDDVTNLQKKSNELDKKAVDLQKKDADLDKKATDLQAKATALEKQAADLQTKATELEKKAADFQKKDADLEKKTTDLQTKATDLEKKAADFLKKDTELEKKTADLQKKDTELEKKTTDLQTKAADLEKKHEELKKRTDALEKK